jgi:DNA-binding HxlR family transcriptional regulator
MKRIVYKSHVTRSIVSYQMVSERMTDMSCSILESVYKMPELKACPIEVTFRIIGKRWTVLIIRELLMGHTQFNRFIQNIGITPKVLTERLRELEHLGMIKRRIVSDYPVRVEYSLTDLGREFESVLLSAASFSMKHMPRTVFKDGRSRIPSDIRY